MKLNGNLTLNALGASQIENAVLERITGALPTVQASEAGRIIYHTDDSTFYFNNATSWVAFATGGSATAIQSEVDAIETSLGTGISAAGAFVGASFTGVASGATSFTDAINLVAAAVAGKDALSELVDVNTGTANANATDGQSLVYDTATSKWINHSLVLADVTDITATAAEVNVLQGIPGTLTATELGYVDGVTGPIQTQLDGKQPIDTTLTGLAALAGTGIVVETSADVFTNRTLVAPAAGITISNADGTAGNPTLVLANDLAAYEGLATTGYVVRTGDGTAATRAIAGGAGNIVVTNGDGVSTDTHVDLAPITQGSTGDFVKVTLDGYGRVTGNTAVVTADITALVDATYVKITGGTMTGDLNMGTTNTVTGLAAPSNVSDAATKAYVDGLVSGGATWRNPVVGPNLVDIVAVASLPGTPNVGDGYIVTDTSGGHTAGDFIVWTGSVWNLVQNVVAGNRFIITGESTATIGTTLDGMFNANDLIQYVSGAFDSAGSWTTPEGLAGTTLPQGTTVLCDDPQSYHFGHSYLYDASGNHWTEIAGPGSIGAGTGLAYSGNILNVNMGAGIVQLPTDEVGIDLYNGPNGALILTTDGTTHTTVTGAKLYLRLDAAGALAQTSSGLKIDAASVTNAMLVQPSVAVNGDTGSTTLPLGDTLEIKGSSVQGIVTSVASLSNVETFTITASDASSSQKGVAKFVSPTFTVTSGNVDIATAGVSNTMLANSSFTVSDGATPQGISLGGTLTVSAAAGTGVAVNTTTTDTITISGIDASTTVKGVASFDAAQFSVTAGAVSLNATLGDLTNVDATTADVTTAGTMLVNDGTNYKGRKIYYLYTGASKTTHVVTHSLGQKYCNVTVVDSTDEVIIPQSITFNSASQLTVVFNTAIACTVVVMGV